MKRIFNIIFSSLGLFFLFPFILVISILVKLSISGSVIFQQKRIGKGGKQFILYKFRTINPSFHPYSTKPSYNHPSINKIGNFLRKSCLDELPQFYNVLKGDMSLVGPRPEMPFLIKYLGQHQKERESVLPGITGLWQVSGKTYEPIYCNLDYDLYYVRNQSFGLDLIILLKTLGLFLKIFKRALNDKV